MIVRVTLILLMVLIDMAISFTEYRTFLAGCKKKFLQKSTDLQLRQEIQQTYFNSIDALQRLPPVQTNDELIVKCCSVLVFPLVCLALFKIVDGYKKIRTLSDSGKVGGASEEEKSDQFKEGVVHVMIGGLTDSSPQIGNGNIASEDDGPDSFKEDDGPDSFKARVINLILGGLDDTPVKVRGGKFALKEEGRSGQFKAGVINQILGGLNVCHDGVQEIDKRFIFDETLDSANINEPSPEYLISNLLSGAHILPPEVILRASPREGRKLQHRFYRKVDLEWDTLRSDAANLNKFANVFTADMVRLVENPSANIMKEEILYGSFKVYKFQLLEEDVNQINAELAMQSEREASDASDKGLLISNMGGYHINVDKFSNHANRILGELSAAAVSLVEAYDQAYLNGNSVDKKNYIRAFAAYADSEGWVNRNQHGHWNSLHTHIGSAWSGVYYVHLPAAEVTARAYSGRLLLKATPHITELKHDLSDLERSRLNLSKDTSNPHYRRDDILGYCDYAEFAPVAGEMIIFPSYLQHAVLPLAIKEGYRDTPAGTRISFAFNFAEKFV